MTLAESAIVQAGFPEANGPVSPVGVAATTAEAALAACPPGRVTKGISNSVPSELARVIPGHGNFPTLGPPTRTDVFVTAAEDINGLNTKQIAQRLTIEEGETFTVIRFPTPQSGLASPVNGLDPGFIGGGRTAGGAREFVIPNGPIPAGARIEVVGQ